MIKFDTFRAVVVRDNPDPTKITSRTVKNLGWLLRHWSEVKYFEVTDEMPEGVKSSWDCILKANLYDGRYYACTWACRKVLWSWLQRPSFFGVMVVWFGRHQTVNRGEAFPDI